MARGVLSLKKLILISVLKRSSVSVGTFGRGADWSCSPQLASASACSSDGAIENCTKLSSSA